MFFSLHEQRFHVDVLRAEQIVKERAGDYRELFAPRVDGVPVTHDRKVLDIEDRELAHLLVTAEEPAAGLRKIIDLASQRGGHDNATGVLIFVDAV